MLCFSLLSAKWMLSGYEEGCAAARGVRWVSYCVLVYHPSGIHLEELLDRLFLLDLSHFPLCPLLLVYHPWGIHNTLQLPARSAVSHASTAEDCGLASGLL